MPMRGDSRDVYRREYNQMLLDKVTGANSIMQEKYITISVAKKDIEEARTYFSRVGADLISHFAALGSKVQRTGRREKSCACFTISTVRERKPPFISTRRI